MPGRPGRYCQLSGEEWAAITSQYPLGSVVVGTVTELFSGNRECPVQFDDRWSVVDYDDNEPVVAGPVRSWSGATWSGPVGSC